MIGSAGLKVRAHLPAACKIIGFCDSRAHLEDYVDFFSLQFLYALGAIVLIDLVLAGDNAIVIALAARKLPPGLRNRAILWGR